MGSKPHERNTLAVFSTFSIGVKYEAVNDCEHTIEVTSLSGSKNKTVAVVNFLIIGNISQVLTVLSRAARQGHYKQYSYYIYVYVLGCFHL